VNDASSWNGSPPDPNLSRLAPQALDAEVSVLGSILIDGSSLPAVKARLQAIDFYRGEHAVIYGAMVALHRRGQPIDLTTVSEELERYGRLQHIGGRGALAALMNAVPSAVHVTTYAETVASCARRRALISVAGKIAAIGYEERDALVAEERALGLLRATIAGHTSLARSTAR
jgi:replicative DNA helicase